MNLKYTLCFIQSADHLLMLNRFKSPNMGLWNGIGGRIEQGETPLQCVIREVEEETGLNVQPRFAGLVTWEGAPETGTEGMYVFVADVSSGDVLLWTAERRHEGILAFLLITWILRPANLGIVDNIPYFLPPMLNGETPAEYHCIYQGGRLRDVIPRAIVQPLEGVSP